MWFFRFSLTVCLLFGSGYNRGDTVNALLLETKVYHERAFAFRSASRLSTDSLTLRRNRSVPTPPGRPFSSTGCDATKKDTGMDPNPKPKPVRMFVEQIEESLERNNFVSFVLRGVKKKKGKKTEGMDESLRGSIRQVQGRLIMISASKKTKKKKGQVNDNQTVLLQMTIKYHGATDICKNFQLSAVPKAVYDLILGDPAEMASEWGIQAVRAKPIQSAQLTTTNQVWDLQLGAKASLRKQKAKTTIDDSASGVTSPIVESHDRTKQVPLSNQAEFFKRLGVTNADGKPKPRMKAKLRQCQKFVEIVGRIVDQSQQNEQKKISVVDMGCGRAYLTFSLHSYLQERYKSVATTGIDVRPKLVAEISSIARSLGGTFDSLNFEEGTIEKVLAETSSAGKPLTDDTTLNVLVALHACDTATDDALYSGIVQNADVIVVAPCCHKQVRRQLDPHFSSTRESHPLSSILKHGVYRERMSETVTDSLRALLLEFAGYKVQVFEFIGGEHTSKNVMITAIKTGEQVATDNRNPNTESIRKEIVSLAALHGIASQKLAQLMGFDLLLADSAHSIPQDLTSRKGNSTQLSKHRMPPALKR